MKKIETALKIALAIAMIGFVAWATNDLLSLPVVTFSHQTGECVRVIPDGNCENLPERYLHGGSVW